MKISQLDKATTEFVSTILKEETREPVELLDTSTHRIAGDQFLIICSVCKNIHIDSSEWVSVEEAVEKLKLFQSEKLPQLTQSLCYNCLDESLQHMNERFEE